jgi:hypothetical protein
LYSRRQCHFDDRGAAEEAPRCIDGRTEWTLHPEHLVCATECIEGALASVSQRKLDALVTGGPARIGDGFGDLMCGGSTAKLVDRRQDPHGF